MKWTKLKRSKIKVFGKATGITMKGMTAQEEHTHFLHSLLTNNIKALKPGTFNYNLWLRQNGQPVGDFFIYKIQDHYLLDTEKPASEVIEEFNKLKLSLRVFFEDLTPSLSHFFVFGEGSSEFIKDAFGVEVKEGEFTQAQEVLIANNPVRVKGDGYDIIGKAETIAQKLPPDLEISETEFEDLRIENCVPKIGKELKEGFSPLEAGVLEYAIDMNKGCYVGQEAIARVYFRGRTPRTLVKVEGEDLEEGDKLLGSDKQVGVITSVNSKKNTALGYLLRNALSDSIRTEKGEVKVRECG